MGACAHLLDVVTGTDVDDDVLRVRELSTHVHLRTVVKETSANT